MFATTAIKSPQGTTIERSSCIASGLPPVSYVITGVPQASASRFTVG